MNANFASTNPSLNDYRALTSGPSFTTPTDAFWSAFQSRLSNMASSFWSNITSGTYAPPSPYQTFRSKLYDAAVQNNSTLIAAVGDKKDGDEPLPTLVPFGFDDYVIGVGGAEVSQTTGQRSYWNGGGTSSFMDIVAAAKDITTLSGDSFNSYNNSFSSTHAASAITGGVVSLLKTQNSSLSYDDIEHILENTAVDIEGAGKDDETGYGFLDAKAALDYINTNDLIRKREQKSNITTISSNQIDSQVTYVMSQGYLEFKPSYLATATYELYGNLYRYVGRINFENTFLNPPDVWLRNSSSGTEVNTVPYYYPSYIQYYDPIGTKSIKVLSVDEYGFTFELKYWKIDFFKFPTNQLVATVEVPNTNNIHIDYTAVGTLGQPPMEVSISGPQNVITPQNVSYSANVLYGSAPYQGFQWFKRNSGSSTWISLGSTSTNTKSIYFGNPSPNIQLKVIVEDANSQQAEDTHNITMFNYSGGFLTGAPPEEIPTEFSLDNNYPNPFNPATQINYALPEAADVTITVYNIMGQKVATLVSASMSAGYHEITFDAGSMSSGMFLARMEAIGLSGQAFIKELKMQLIK